MNPPHWSPAVIAELTLPALLNQQRGGKLPRRREFASAADAEAYLNEFQARTADPEPKPEPEPGPIPT